MSNENFMEELADLIKRAEREGKWLESTYQNIPFSPSELREQNAQGEYRWGVSNWRLIDPRSLLRDEAAALKSAREHNANILKRMGKR